MEKEISAYAPSRQRLTYLSVTCLGISTLVTQLVLLRAFLSVFTGNELVIGIILGNWLLLTGLGSYLGQYAARGRRPLAWLLTGQVVIGVLPLLQLAAGRAFKLFIVPGTQTALGTIFLFSLGVLLPYCLASGGMLTLFAGLAGEKGGARQIGRVYVLDVTGDIIGGVLFSFLLVHFLNPYQILVFLLVLNLLAATLLAWDSGRRLTAGAVLAVLAAGLTVAGTADLEKRTAGYLYPGQLLLYRQDTPYGSLAVTGNGQLAVYQNGVPVGATDNVKAAEETVHFGLSQHPDPRSLLLISGGLDGVLAEAVKYPLDRIDYLELDPMVIRLVTTILPNEADERVTMVAEDARRFIRRRHQHYDAVLVDLPDPATAQLNRFHTVEFFREVRQVLRRGGIFGFSLSGSENYTGPENRRLASSVYRSLQAAFPHTLIIPGGRRYFLASDRELDHDVVRRLDDLNIATRYVNEDYLRARLTADRLAAARRAVSADAPVNRDLRPQTYYAHLRFWLARQESGLFIPLLTGILLVVTSLALVRRTPVPAVAAAITLTGFSGLGLELILLYAFQSLEGYIYHQLGILVTAFLAGTAAGAGWSRLRLSRSSRLLFRIDLLLALFALLLPPLLFLLQQAGTPFPVPFLLFPLLNAGLGFLTGAQFPPAASLVFTSASGTAGTLYALDFLGAALGALLVTAFAVPILGIPATCYAIGALKLVTAAALRYTRTSAPRTSPATGGTAAPFWPAFLLFTAAGFLIVHDSGGSILYALSFHPLYYWLVLSMAGIGLVRAVRAAGPGAEPARRIRLAELPVSRWLHYLAFSLVVFFPIFRCYFKVPFLFCHVCPRQCVFGFLRPYLVPAALIMNLERRYWCFHACPIGTIHDCQTRLSGRGRRLPAALKPLAPMILIFTANSYFKLENDLKRLPDTDGDWFTAFYRNSFTPETWVILAAAGFLLAGFLFSRPFCDSACPVGTLSRLLLKLEKSK